MDQAEGLEPQETSDISFLVIVHSDNPIETLTPAAVSDLFLKEEMRWGDGTGADPVNLDSTSEIRNSFSHSIHGRSTANIQSFWQKQIFSGKGVPPQEVETEEGAVDFVRANRGGVAYVSGQVNLDGVKVVNVRTEARRVEYVVPSYPSAARSAGVRGTVQLGLSIDKSGNVTDVKVIKGLGFGLSEAAVKAAKRWRFVPATENGRPVQSSLSVNVEF